MSSSDYFIQSLVTIKDSLQHLSSQNDTKIQKLICFGIGPFTRNFQALHQLAFILCIQRHFKIEHAEYFDPIFRDSEKQVLQQLKCLLMQRNCEAKYKSEVPTLYYMPHCPNCLTNNLLWFNWSPQYLHNSILINNSFESLASSKPERILRLDSNYILDILPYVKELPLEDDYEVHNVFNDLSVHVFPQSNVPNVENQTFWIQKEAPSYKDVEMISQQDFEKLQIS